MRTDYDVIIVGAGPAGASCAKHLVDNGVKTLVIEKKKLSHDKCCSGLISERGINFVEDNFGEIPASVKCKNYELKVRQSKTGKMFIEIPGLNYYNIFRDKFDYWLIKKSYANVLDSHKLVDIKNEKNSIGIAYWKTMCAGNIEFK